MNEMQGSKRVGELSQSIKEKFEEARPLTAAIKARFQEVRAEDIAVVIKNRRGPVVKLDVETQRELWSGITTHARSMATQASTIIVTRDGELRFFAGTGALLHEEQLAGSALTAMRQFVHDLPSEPEMTTTPSLNPHGRDECDGDLVEKDVTGPEQVNHPAHYGGGDDPYEAIKVIEAWGLGFNLGNAVKYIRRLGSKGDPVEQLRKVAFYIQREIDLRIGNKPAETVRSIVAGHDALTYDLQCTKEAFTEMTRLHDAIEKEKNELARKVESSATSEEMTLGMITEMEKAAGRALDMIGPKHPAVDVIAAIVHGEETQVVERAVTRMIERKPASKSANEKVGRLRSTTKRELEMHEAMLDRSAKRARARRFRDLEQRAKAKAKAAKVER